MQIPWPWERLQQVPRAGTPQFNKARGFGCERNLGPQFEQLCNSMALGSLWEGWDSGWREHGHHQGCEATTRSRRTMRCHPVAASKAL